MLSSKKLVHCKLENRAEVLFLKKCKLTIKKYIYKYKNINTVEKS